MARLRSGMTLGSCLLAMAITTSPPALAEDCGRARGLYEQGTKTEDYVEKARIYREAVRLCPGYPEARNNLADALQQLGRLDEAESAYREALGFNPDLTAAHFGLGEIYLQMGLYEQAAAALRRGLALYPGEMQAERDLIRAERGCTEAGAGADGKVLTAPEIVAARSQQPVTTMGPGGTRLKTIRIRFPNILFDVDSDRIRSASGGQIDEIRKGLASSELSAFRFLIEGHTDSTGEEPHNLVLSQRRAASVRNVLLVGAGPSDLAPRVEAVGFGETRLLANPEATREDKQRNRRVEVVLIERDTP